MAKFIVVEGHHAEAHIVKDEKGCPKLDAAGNPAINLRQYNKGSVIETDTPLDKKFNQPGFEKFRRLDDQGNAINYDPNDLWSRKPDESPQEFAERVAHQARQTQGLAESSVGASGGNSPLTPSQANIATAMSSSDYRRTLEAMDVKELRKVAEEEEINLPKNANKDEAIRAIMAASSAQQLK
jgi:hypothetical protein